MTRAMTIGPTYTCPPLVEDNSTSANKNNTSESPHILLAIRLAGVDIIDNGGAMRPVALANRAVLVRLPELDPVAISPVRLTDSNNLAFGIIRPRGPRISRQSAWYLAVMNSNALVATVGINYILALRGRFFLHDLVGLTIMH